MRFVLCCFFDRHLLINPGREGEVSTVLKDVCDD